ncbi:tetratricopeptide repeat protein [Leptotrichia trevisanii]|uniref:tetratricopeptide repeat protein n=1 Tax=Leptotrichia trevisanii TaxID=109328 RepID=UPI000400A6A8|nr:tetratricopeptide repeat protein [Leptotrichia trevisanii]
MKKVLIGLFLIASLSVLGVNKGKVPMQRDIDYVRYHYELDSKYENLFSKEKKEFKDKWGNNNKKNLIALVKKYIEKYPDDAYAYEVLGTAYMSDNFKEAEANFLKAIKLGDDDTAKYSLALLYADKGEKDNDKEKTKLAEKYLKELENEGINSHYNLENLRNVKNGALIGYAEPIFGLAAYYDNYENYKISEKYATEFLEFDKENLDNLMFLSNAYIAQKKYAESEKLFLPLAQKGMMQAQYLLALGYYHAGNLKEAEKWAKKTLEKPERKQSDDIEAAKELLNRINSKLKELNKK